MSSLLHFPVSSELGSWFMDVHEAPPRPHHTLSRRIPSWLLCPDRFVSSFTRHHVNHGNIFRFTLCIGSSKCSIRSPVMSTKNGQSTSTSIGLCDVVWIVEAELAAGQFLYITGDPTVLGCWEPEMAIRLTPTKHANLWKAEAKIASGVNFKYNYFIRREDWSSCDIIWRPGPELSLSTPLFVTPDKNIVVRDLWVRTSSERSLAHVWGSWIEDTYLPLEPSVSVPARDEDECSDESKPFLNVLTIKDDMNSNDEVTGSATHEGPNLNAVISERNQPVEEPWLSQSPLLFLPSTNRVKLDASGKIETAEDEIMQLDIDNVHDQGAEELLPEGGSSNALKEDPVSTIILINSSICTMQRIAVLEDGKLVELLLEPVKSNVQCDSVYLGVVTKLVPHMGGAFVNIGNSRHSLMDIQQYREPFVFAPFRQRLKKIEVNGHAFGALEGDSASHEVEHISQIDEVIDDVAEVDSREDSVHFMHNDYDEPDVDDDFDVSEDVNDNVNGSMVDFGEVEADFEDCLDGGEHQLGSETVKSSLPIKIESRNGSERSHPQDLKGSKHEMSNENIWAHVRKGTKIIVQVVKEGLGTKGPTLTAYPKLRSRFWILISRCNRLGVSKKISGVERTRLKLIAKTLQPEGFGLTVRTVAAGHCIEELQQDLEGLLSTWKAIMEHAKSAALATDEGVKGAIPVILHRAMGQTLSVVQDYFNDKVKKMVVDSPRTYHEVTNYLQEIDADLCDRVELYDQRIPLFDEYNVEDEINNILSKRVPLPNGGSLVIEQTEALVSIDVNGGHGMFGHGTSQEKAILEVNLAAAKQIAREIRLRDIGGIIVVDFIDMADESNKRLVYEEVKKAVERDRSMVKVCELSKHGLMEITRKRVRPSVTFMISEPCTSCHATGRVEALETLFLKIEQEICRLLATMQQKADPENPKSWPRFVLRVDNHMCNFLTSGKRTRLATLSSSLKVWILLKVARGFTRGAFELAFAEEKANKNQSQVAISLLRPAEARTNNPSRKVTLVPVKKWKGSSK